MSGIASFIHDRGVFNYDSSFVMLDEAAEDNSDVY